jgi:hypothetical protein
MADDILENLQDVSAIGGLAGADLMFGLKPGAPDDDFKVSLDDLTNYVSNSPILATATATAQNTLEIINGVNGVVFDSTYEIYTVEYRDVYRNTGSAGTLLMQFTTDGGSTWITTGAGNYEFAHGWVTEDNANSRLINNQTLGYAAIDNFIGSAATFQQHQGNVHIFNPAFAGDVVYLSHSSGFNIDNPTNLTSIFGGGVLFNRVVDGVRFRIGIGADTFSGEFVLRGIKTS